jgi:DNA-binding response OmpR family regulator
VAAPEIYAFGEFTLDATGRSLARRDAAIHLAPKAHDLLVALVRQRRTGADVPDHIRSRAAARASGRQARPAAKP